MAGRLGRHFHHGLLGLVLAASSAACRASSPSGSPVASLVAPRPVDVAVAVPRAVESMQPISPGSPGSQPAPGVDVRPLAPELSSTGLAPLQGRPRRATERLFGDIDWNSVARMNLGTPSPVALGKGWGMSVGSGMDRLEECEPTLALQQHGPGFTDTFVFLAAHYRLSRSAHLVGGVAGIRMQDRAISDVVGQAVSAVTLGVYFNF